MRSWGFRKLELEIDFRDYQLTIDKILRYGVMIAPDQLIEYAPPKLPIKQYTYRELYERVNKLGYVLEELGLRKAEKPRDMGSRVAVVDWNSTRYLELMFAVPMYGATLFTVNIRLAPEEIVYTMNLTEPEVLFIHTDFLPYLNALLSLVKTIRKVVVMSDEITVKGSGEVPRIAVPSGVEVYEYEELLRNKKPQYPWPDLNEYTIAEIFFTSGTTGRPKGVYHTHRQIVLGTMQILIAGMEYPIRMSSRDVQLMTTPMFHILGWLHPYTSVLSGARMVFPGRYDWAHITRLIYERYIPEAQKVGGRVVAMGVPTMLISIIDNAKAMGVKSLKGFVYGYGGQALPVAVYEEAKKLGIEIVTGYGPSETLTAITRMVYIPRLWMRMGLDDEKLRDYFVINNSLGVPVPLTLVKVVDEKGNELPWDGKSTGRLIFYSPTITREYYKDVEKTEYAWRFGYFDVDDIVVIDETGAIFFIDREKDAVKSGGEWIPSSRLEMFISTHPAVKEVAIIGVPHPRWIERPVAIVVPKPEYEGKVAEEEIKEYLQKEYVDKNLMPKWWIPDKVIFIKDEEMPRTSTAKIDKKMLRERYKNILQGS
jgi:fatty-acyl-CoA synthase